MKKPSAELVKMQTLLQDIVAKQDKQELLINQLLEKMEQLEKMSERIRRLESLVDILGVHTKCIKPNDIILDDNIHHFYRVIDTEGLTPL